MVRARSGSFSSPPSPTSSSPQSSPVPLSLAAKNSPLAARRHTNQNQHFYGIQALFQPWSNSGQQGSTPGQQGSRGESDELGSRTASQPWTSDLWTTDGAPLGSRSASTSATGASSSSGVNLFQPFSHQTLSYRSPNHRSQIGAGCAPKVPLLPCLPLTWIFGLLLVLVSQDASTELEVLRTLQPSRNMSPGFDPLSNSSFNKRLLQEHRDHATWTLEIFAAPPLLHSEDATWRHKMAVGSWLNVGYVARVWLVGGCPVLHQELLNLDRERVLIEKEIDKSILTGDVQLHSLFSRAQASQASVGVVVHPPDTVLLPDFTVALGRLRKVRGSWVMVVSGHEVGAALEVPQSLRKAWGKEGGRRAGEKSRDSIFQRREWKAEDGSGGKDLEDFGRGETYESRGQDYASWPLQLVLKGGSPAGTAHCDVGSWILGGPGGEGMCLESKQLAQLIRETKQVNPMGMACSPPAVWAWNNGGAPLVSGVVPPFILFRNNHLLLSKASRTNGVSLPKLSELAETECAMRVPLQWLLSETLRSDIRQTVDASAAVTAFTVADRWQAAGQPALEEGASQLLELETDGQDFFGLKIQRTALRLNLELAIQYGAFLEERLEASDIPFSMVPCPQDGSSRGDSGGLCFLERAQGVPKNFGMGKQWPLELPSRDSEAGHVPCRFAMEVSIAEDLKAENWKCIRDTLLTDPDGVLLSEQRVFVEQHTRILGDSKAARIYFFEHHATPKESIAQQPGKTWTSLDLKALLRLVTRQQRDKAVVAAVASSSYRDTLASWACAVQKLGVKNFVIAALDVEILQFGLEQGLPMFPHIPSETFNPDHCHFGTTCFHHVTKLKSRVALEILRAGYDVLFNDVDVYWFRNPLPFLLSTFGSGQMAVQCDHWNDTAPDNDLFRLNSGFYFLRSEGRSIAALEAIVDHAAKSNTTEQPSFYKTLCGEAGQFRVGDTHCYNPKLDITVQYLDRKKFPNGAMGGLFNQPQNVRSTCSDWGCYVLHNNWLTGRKRKLKRQMEAGLWDYEETRRMCRHSWVDSRPTQAF